MRDRNEIRRLYMEDEMVGHVHTFPNRTWCDVMEDMRKCHETRNYAGMLGLIEEAQTFGYRMESALSDQEDYRSMNKELHKLKLTYKPIRKEIIELEAQKEKLEEEISKLEEKKNKLEGKDSDDSDE